MAYFINGYPYSDTHNLNLDWVIDTLKRIATEVGDLHYGLEIHVTDTDGTEIYTFTVKDNGVYITRPDGGTPFFYNFTTGTLHAQNIDGNNILAANGRFTGDVQAGSLKTSALTIDANEHPDAQFKQNGGVVGDLVFSTSTRRANLREYPAGSSYYEQYYLPTPNGSLAANASYSILTSKTPVSVEQGGTGDTGTVDGPLAGTHANVTVSEVRLRRWGRAVAMSGQFTSTTALDALVTLFTLPVGFRSTTNTVVNTRIFNGSTGASLSAYTDKNGAFICRSAIAANTQYYFDFSFII